MSKDHQRSGNGSIPGTRRKAVPIAMAMGPAEYTAEQVPGMWMDWPQGLSGRDALASSSPCVVADRRTIITEPRDAALPRLGP